MYYIVLWLKTADDINNWLLLVLKKLWKLNKFSLMQTLVLLEFNKRDFMFMNKTTLIK